MDINVKLLDAGTIWIEEFLSENLTLTLLLWRFSNCRLARRV